MKRPYIQFVRWSLALWIVVAGVVNAQEGGVFRRGDANGDGRVDVADSIAILGSLYFESAGRGRLSEQHVSAQSGVRSSARRR